MNKDGEYKFTLQSALEAKENGTIKNWVQSYLRNEGKNYKLADFLKDDKNVWVDLIKYDLNKLSRNFGPEEEMIFNENKKVWEKRINNFIELIRNGFNPSPIIVTDFWGEIKISDGTHRFEALKKVGIQEYWTIFYLKNSNNIKTVLDNI